MKHYFGLQAKLLRRKIEDLGIPAWSAALLGILLWFGYHRLIDQHPDWAPYALGFLTVYLCFPLSSIDRNHFLKIIFSPKRYKSIRITENLLICVAPLSLLLVKSYYVITFATLLTSLILAFISFRSASGRSLPTPFSKHPFEGILFVRKLWWAILIFYTIVVIAIFYSNFNLGLIASWVFIGVFTSSLEAIEPEYFVWINRKSPLQFIIHKAWRCFIQLSLLWSPAFWGLLIGFPDQWHVILIMLICSLFVTATWIITKYSSYPRPISLPFGLLLGFSFLFPPLCLLILPLFYQKTIDNLNRIL